MDVSSIITPIGVVLAAIGVLYTAWQLLLAQRVHKANHDWHRRHAAMVAVAELSEALRELDELATHFDELVEGQRITKEKYEKVVEANPEVEMMCRRLLDMYENLATGVEHMVYDEDVVKSARRTDLITTYDCLEVYVKDRRQSGHRSAYDCLEALANKWRAEKTPVPQRNNTDV